MFSEHFRLRRLLNHQAVTFGQIFEVQSSVMKPAAFADCGKSISGAWSGNKNTRRPPLFQALCMEVTKSNSHEILPEPQVNWWYWNIYNYTHTHTYIYIYVRVLYWIT